MESQRNNEQVLGAGDRPTRGGKGRKIETRLLSRRAFLGQAGQLAAALALIQASGILSERGWLEPAYAAQPDTVRDTLNGLIAFIVPGPDPYSVAQGVSTPEPGGIDAGIIDILIATLDQVTVPPPPFATVSEAVAAILNGTAQAVNPAVDGFAQLTFPEKVFVFQFLESDPTLAPIAGALPFFVAFLAYSEAGVFDPGTRTLTGQPVGWTLSGYEGVADGRDEFIGYFENRKKVDK